MPTMFVVAGPNACGKSTLTRTTRFAGSDEIWLYDNASLDHPYSVVAILSGGAKWIAESSPDWATAALGSVT